ncbi:MAG: hypothetical protein HFI34_09305 [Lachnospiraceae bacterium]|nr:hypothetical protein [Lachnospiraceae bacterium]
MKKVYNDTPDNFAEIQTYVITNVEDIAKAIILADKCFFYDACAFRNHMRILNPECIFEYIKRMGGIVVITRCIVMELCSNDNLLWKEHIEYLKKMYQYGIKILLMYEEDAFHVLNTCYSGTAQINLMLSFAIRAAKSKTGTIENILNNNSALRKEIFISSENKDSSLAKRFFREARNGKSSGDDLGETLVAVCIHMLSNIREITEYKYIMLTDDKGAIASLGKVMKNVKEYIGSSCISGITTPKLCQLMVQEHIIEDKKEIESIINAGSIGEFIKIYCSEQFELSPCEKSISVAEFAKKITNNAGVKIYL